MTNGSNVTIFTVVKPKGEHIISTGGQASAAIGYALKYNDSDLNSFSTFKDSNGGSYLKW